MKTSFGAISGLVALLIANQVIGAQAVGSDTEASIGNGDAKAMATPDTPEAQARAYSRYRFNTLGGPTGLLRTSSADSGAPGTFRLSYALSFYSGKGFLCATPAACGIANSSQAEDSVSRHGEDVALSVTFTRFLEANLAVHSQSVSDDLQNPSVMQVLADTQLGVKAFMPRSPDKVFTAGGIGQLKLLGGSGNIGPSTANVMLGTLATLDLTNRTDVNRRIPLRFNANLGYIFDNSGTLADKTERTQGRPVSRFERFGLGIHRVNSVLLGLGGEFVHPVVQPFIEWTMDVTANRQSYVCRLAKSAPGDDCLSRAGTIAGAPSRLTLGAHVTPPLGGLSAMLAFDIGTSGTSHFIAERAPEIPWNFYLALGYAIDTYAPTPRLLATPKPVETVHEKPRPEYRILGHVTDETTGKPITLAKVTFEGKDETGLVTKADGTFVTNPLDPGEYTFSIAASDYRDANCKATVAPIPEAKAGTEIEGSPTKTEIQCSLRATPAVAMMSGEVIDAESSMPVPNCQLIVTDERQRSVEVNSDALGAFTVRNVPAGKIHLRASAAGYLPSARQIEIAKNGELYSTIVLRKAPKVPSVTLTAKELKLKVPLNFADTAPPSANASLIAEIAALLLAHPEVSKLALHSYTENSGNPEFDKRQSKEQAVNVQAQLVALGVIGNRLTVVAHGNEAPVAPSSTPANKAKNRRIIFAITQSGALK